jgi:hypothetical protein
MATYQQEKRMPFIPSWDRIALQDCLLHGLEVALQLKFGDEGLALMPELRELHDHELLRIVLDAILTAASPDELRRVWTRKRRSKKKKQA